MEFTQSEFNVKSTVSGVGCLLSIACNVPVFILLLVSRRLQEDIATRAIASLALADFGLGAVVPLISTVIGSHGLGYRAPFGLLEFYGCVSTVTGLSAIWHLALVSIIRCCVIIRPLTYRSIFSNRVLYGSIGTVWAFCVLTCVVAVSMGARWGFNFIAFIPLLTNFAGGLHFAYAYLVMNTFAPAAIIIAAYFKIFLVVRQQLRTIRPQEINQGGPTGLILTSIKAAKNLFVMIAVYGAAYLPTLFMLIPLKFPLWYGFAATWIFYYNAAFNALLYVLLHRSVRQEFRKLFFPCCHKRRSRPQRSDSDATTRSTTGTSTYAVAVVLSTDH